MIKIKKGGRKRLEEKAASKSQQALFGMALSVKTGEKKLEDFGAGLQEKLKKIVDTMTEKQIRDYAETKTKKLPNKVEESVKEDDLVTFMQGDIHRYGRVLSINTSKQTANVEYEHSGEETTDDIPLGKLSVIQKIPENKTFKRMPHLKDLYEFSAVPTKVISEADLRKIAEYINSLGYIASIPNSANTIYTTTLIGPVAETHIKDFIDNMGLKVIINNGQMSSTISIYEEGEATLDSTVGRGEFSAGNNPADASDTTKGSGEKFGDVKKKKVGEEEIFTVQDLEKYYYDNEDYIVDNMNTYGWDVDSLSGLGNYVDLANVLGIDSRKVKDVELDVYVATLIELLKMR